MTKSKLKLHLVSDKAMKQRYDMFYVHIYDGACYEYKLDEWDVYKDAEWIEITRVDGTVMECFNIPNVLMVRFKSSKSKEVYDKPTLQPVA